MAEERIDIKVTDSGSDKAAKGLRAIASEALKAQKAVDQVSANLSKLPTAQLNAMANMAAKAAEASARLATAEERAAAAIERTRAATERANAAAYASQAAKARAEAAEIRLAAARDRAAASASKEAAATNAATTATNLNAAASVRATKNSKAMAQATLNLSRQFADIGVTAAMGMNPLMILIQQGPQVADAFQMAKTQGLGFTAVLKGATAGVATLAAVMAPLLIVGGAVALMFKGLQREANQKYPDITKGMGLSAEQLKEVENRTITFADTILGVMDTLGEDIANSWMGKVWKWLTEQTGLFTDSMFTNIRWGIAGIVAAFKAAGAFISQTWEAMTKGNANAMAKSYNSMASMFDKYLKYKTRGIRQLIELFNKIPGVSIPIPEIELPKFEGLSEGGAEAGKTYGEFFREALQEEIAAQDNFINRSMENALERAQKRAREQAGDADKGRKGRSGRTPEETREEALRRVNAQLDNEISRMGMLKREREIQQRFDQIEEQLLRQRITLTEQEASAIREKLETIRQETEIQSAMDRIYDDLNKTTNEYNATLEAAERLLDAGRISYEQYAQAVTKAKNAHDEAIDPLYRMGLEHDAAMRAAKAYGDQAQRVAYYEQIRNQLMREGIALSAQYVAGENAKVDALMRENNELMRQQQINSTIGSIVDPLKEKEMMLANEQYYYDELKRLREIDYLNEEQYAQAKAQLEYKYKEMRLSNYSDMFGKLAGLASSGNRELAAIGKAAAITQATIDGYLAVQKALASAPPPMNYINAAVTGAATAAQIAGIMSTNVGNFATGGQIMVGGRDGVDKNNINMNVTKGERITIETPAQQKATDEAIARGQSGGRGGDVQVSNINVIDPRFVIDSMDTAAGSRVITNIITANKREINAILGSR